MKAPNQDGKAGNTVLSINTGEAFSRYISQEQKRACGFSCQRTGRPNTSVMQQRGAPLADEVVQAVRRPARGQLLRERAVLLVARPPDLPLVSGCLPARVRPGAEVIE